ncbi:hypothetical protein SERLADRAFT_478633 [Serpula lacrymans var. lacrymans S7.9]|uniref:Uncharacterized protein n=1 Tax=Serpula lacrymans var. lacrymans (strain S7.9) TaxID=578457 RepID=F8PA23_SERL9|nr:uncharacterized protein SERLADRAFT_478633 [Serpula lacrymans var. lacrymans S7.9]EGO20021.1 hypothetical protein SERLADRAFT_478633 [Serpula lacrymans var. lacrymans S7.9]
MNGALTGKFPSANTKTDNYCAHQGQETPILDGCYTRSLAPPIEPYHHVFAEFKVNIRDTSLHAPPSFAPASQIGTTEGNHEKVTQ